MKILELQNQKFPVEEVGTVGKRKLFVLIVKHDNMAAETHYCASNWLDLACRCKNLKFEYSFHKSNVANGVSMKRNCVSVADIYMCGKMNVMSHGKIISISTSQNSDVFPIIN